MRINALHLNFHMIIAQSQMSLCWVCLLHIHDVQPLHKNQQVQVHVRIYHTRNAHYSQDCLVATPKLPHFILAYTYNSGFIWLAVLEEE